jgi:hypothetical protein
VPPLPWGWPTWRPWLRRARCGSRRCASSPREALLTAEAAAFSLPSREHYEAARARAREALGDAAYQAAVVAGQALTVEHALAEAEVVLERDRNGGAGATPVL